MENASKALLIAAEVLIGIMILSLAAYLYATFSQKAREVQKLNEDQQLVQFNTQYTVYENRDDITIYDIITVVNMAKENNIECENDKDDYRYITVNIGNINISGGVYNMIPSTFNAEENGNKTNLDNLRSADIETIKGENAQLPTYKCTCTIGENSKGRVSKVEFKRN